jgi:hypothetical protein
MILSKNVRIIVDTNKDKTYHKFGYYEKGVKNEKLEINVNIEHLSKSSREYIDVKCDICGKEK